MLGYFMVNAPRATIATAVDKQATARRPQYYKSDFCFKNT